jgi:hypothetical protein
VPVLIISVRIAGIADHEKQNDMAKGNGEGEKKDGGGGNWWQPASFMS